MLLSWHTHNYIRYKHIFRNLDKHTCTHTHMCMSIHIPIYKIYTSTFIDNEIYLYFCLQKIKHVKRKLNEHRNSPFNLGMNWKYLAGCRKDSGQWMVWKQLETTSTMMMLYQSCCYTTEPQTKLHFTQSTHWY